MTYQTYPVETPVVHVGSNWRMRRNRMKWMRNKYTWTNMIWWSCFTEIVGIVVFYIGMILEMYDTRMFPGFGRLFINCVVGISCFVTAILSIVAYVNSDRDDNDTRYCIMWGFFGINIMIGTYLWHLIIPEYSFLQTFGCGILQAFVIVILSIYNSRNHVI